MVEGVITDREEMDDMPKPGSEYLAARSEQTRRSSLTPLPSGRGIGAGMREGAFGGEGMGWGEAWWWPCRDREMR